MPDQPELPKVPDPLHGLREAVDAHDRVATASRAAGAAVQAEKQAPPAEPEGRA